jgi:hypothetical protein
MKNPWPEILAVLAVITAIGVLVHQKIAHHFWFSWPDFWHHETAEAGLVTLAIGLVLGKYLGGGGKS